MVIQCDGCQAKFRLDDSKMKPSGVKVRCPKCKNLFTVMPDGGPGIGAPAATPPPTPAVAPPLQTPPSIPASGEGLAAPVAPRPAPPQPGGFHTGQTGDEGLSIGGDFASNAAGSDFGSFSDEEATTPPPAPPVSSRGDYFDPNEDLSASSDSASNDYAIDFGSAESESEGGGGIDFGFDSAQGGDSSPNAQDETVIFSVDSGGTPQSGEEQTMFGQAPPPVSPGQADTLQAGGVAPSASFGDEGGSSSEAVSFSIDDGDDIIFTGPPKKEEKKKKKEDKTPEQVPATTQASVPTTQAPAGGMPSFGDESTDSDDDFGAIPSFGDEGFGDGPGIDSSDNKPFIGEDSDGDIEDAPKKSISMPKLKMPSLSVDFDSLKKPLAAILVLALGGAAYLYYPSYSPMIEPYVKPYIDKFMGSDEDGETTQAQGKPAPGKTTPPTADSSDTGGFEMPEVSMPDISMDSIKEFDVHAFIGNVVDKIPNEVLEDFGKAPIPRADDFITFVNIKGEFKKNSKLGTVYVLEGTIKNRSLEKAVDLIEARGVAYSSYMFGLLDKTLYSSWSEPGRKLSDEEVATFSKAEIEKALNPSKGKGTKIMPGAVMPVYIVFTELPKGMEKAGIEVAF